MIDCYLGAAARCLRNRLIEKKYSDEANDVPKRRMSRAYVYLPIMEKHLRLLVLHPGERRDVLSATLVHTSLEKLSRSEYETISYAWGDASIRSYMLVDKAFLDIPASAAEVLRQVRHKRKSRRLWIDAVCINQADVHERQEQVTFMRYIYTDASANIIYLGQSDNHTEAALKTVRDILADLASQVQDSADMQDLLYNSNGSPTIESGHSRGSPYNNEALQSLYDRPWFTRLWVIQEAALSPKNVCLWGQHQMQLLELLLAAVWYRFKNYRFEVIRDKSLIKAARFYDAVYYGSSHDYSLRNRRSLASYLDLSRHFKSSLASDKVFAMLGLLDTKFQNNDFWRLLTPDYHKTEHQVFTDAFRAALMQDQSLHRPLSMNFVHHRDQIDVNGTGLPSWVPELRRKGDRSQEAYELCPRFHACSHGYRQHYIPPVTSNVLTLKGLFIDDIVSVGPVLPFAPTWMQTIDFVELSAEVAQVGDLNAAASEATQTFARTLIAGVDVQLRRRSSESTAIAFVQWHMQIKSILMLDPNATGEDTTTRDFASAFSQACHMRRVYRTSLGFLGLGPKLTQVGDQAVVLYGCHTISVLRPGTTEDYHRFVGQGYMDGMMDGEAFGRVDGSAERHRIFHLQ